MLAAPAAALDLFTLWRQPMIPLAIRPGDWADYQTTTLVEGRRSEDLFRVQCVGEVGAGESAAWLLELLPLAEASGGPQPVPGEGVLLQISRRLLRREGDLIDLVERVVRWQDGEPTELAPADWRDDPLVTSSLRGEFMPERSERAAGSVRVVDGRELACDHFVLAAADTQSVQLPRARLEQITGWEVTAAISGEVPFLGLAFATERTRASSSLDPPSDRFAPPPPTLRVETMELVGFGTGAASRLGGR